ncbi:MAG TPA: hypothetical protein VFV73_25825 [Streptosporangiaceae bacterium]|nr:hypothetical protein [Streptosporangiaceae bacterium]
MGPPRSRIAQPGVLARGTIASICGDGSAGATTPTLTADDIAASVVGMDEVAELRPGRFLQQS